NDAAYRHHIATAHFKTYKEGTLHMVKHLDLVDMTPMNAAGLPAVFRKMK
ncbi:MAG: antibiotic biosynthesis monooxygenase, partial [Bacteroidales bacterium]|nr:antibiotic biosynthesis monooxygenase [Bacteroidales bacterium]